MPDIEPLKPDALYRHCDPDQFSFETTADLTETREIVGQERAVAAVRFGTGIEQEGYNLFALGPKGTGKYETIRHFLEQKAANEPPPSDWCYVNNFKQRHRPRALTLPPGEGQRLSGAMESLVDELFASVPAAFESEEYQGQRQVITEELQQKQEASLEELTKKARERNIALIRTQAGLAFAPLADGEVVAPEQFMAMPEEERERIQGEINELQDELQRVMRQVPQWSRETRDKLRQLNEEIAGFAITPLFQELRERYADFAEVLAYLEEVQEDITENIDKFLQSAQQNPLAALMQAAGGGGGDSSDGGQFNRQSPFFNRYKINVLVDHGETEGAPVVYEDHPTYQNLIGRVEHIAQMGALLTDFTLIKAGALHRANGGYLIIDSVKLLSQPFAWDSLKRALQAGEVKVESLGQSLSLISTVSLEPEAIPLDLKVVLLGERLLYYLLHQHDPEFGELFRVAADFEDEIARSEEANLVYAQFIAHSARQDGLRPFDRTAVARMIEYASRLTSDQERISTHVQSVADMLRQANYWAGEAGEEVVTAGHVQQAIDAYVYRNSRLRERMQEAILRDTVFIDTTGERVGQINGLAVLAVGNYTFGRPSRISARVRMGKGEVVDIERQIEMGGPIHSKGVLILSGFLGGRYATDRPLSLSASLVFEQHYSGVDGDSASSAELYALLSALADVPIKQSLAVTGSVNQHGQVQPIGGANEKIEGFFDICNARGLTGDQGVLIPEANVKNLMLRQDVREAVAAGTFHIYPVTTIDEGIELLTGMTAGEPDEEGNYPDGTFNEIVQERLTELARRQRRFAKDTEEEEEEEGEEAAAAEE